MYTTKFVDTQKLKNKKRFDFFLSKGDLMMLQNLRNKVDKQTEVSRFFRLCLLAALFCLFGQTLSAPSDIDDTQEKKKEQDLQWEQSEIQTIEVTAQKRKGDMQETPIALSVATADDLDNNIVRDLRDVATFTPGLVIGGNAGWDYPTSIRGISSAVSGIGADTPVAVYVDGVYLGRPSSSVFELVNMERVEVLRGPQGTLYGRNATGGAINIITKSPTDSLDVSFDSDYSRFDAQRIRAAVNGPLLKGKLYGSFSGAFYERDGWGVNMDGRRLNGEENHNLRGTLRYLLEDQGSVVFRIDSGESDEVFAAKDISGTVFTDIGDESDFFINEEPSSNRKYWGASITVDYEFPAFNFTSITAAREHEHGFFFDSDAGPNQFARIEQELEDQKQVSQEIRFASKEDTDLKWILGMYYFTEDSNTNLFFDFFALNLTNGYFPTNETRSHATFGEVTYSLSPMIEITGGIRYSRETKDFTNSLVRVPSPGDRPGPGSIEEKTDTWDSWTPRVVANVSWREGFMTYFSISKGFKSGGFNFLSLDEPFKQEELLAYEAGFKFDGLNRRLRLNGALFNYDYTDLQVRIPGVPGQIFIQNAAEATVQGVELESIVKTGSGWEFTGNVTYLDATYDSFLRLQREPTGEPMLDDQDNPVFEDLSGNVLNRAPKWKLGASAEYIFQPNDYGSFRGFLSYSHQSRTFYTEVNEASASHDGWNDFSGRFGFTMFNGWGISMVGKNLTNERYASHVIPIGAWRAALYNPPRTYGLEISYKY